MNKKLSNRLGQKRIIWVGGYPAHYIRTFHRAIEDVHPEKLGFFYIQNKNSLQERGYEQGALPRASVVFHTPVSPLKIIRMMHQLNPRAIVVAGHYPRSLLVFTLWGFKNERPVFYWSDTNLLDILSTTPVKQIVLKAFMSIYLGRMHKLLYIGTRNKDFYIWALGKRIDPNKLCWVPIPHFLPIHESSFRTEQLPGDIYRVLYLGRLSKVKAVDTLIKALGLLPTHVKEKTILSIAGDGPDRPRLEKIVQESGLTDRVHFLGAIQSNDVPRILQGADVFVLPSKNEAWGLVVNEALSAGKPVITPYWVGAVADLVVDGFTGLVTRNNRPSDFVKAIVQLIENPVVANQMGANGKELVRTGGWSIEGALRAINEIVEEFNDKE